MSVPASTSICPSPPLTSFFGLVYPCCLSLSTVVSYKTSLSKSTHNLAYVESCNEGFPCAAPAPSTRSIVLLNSSGLRPRPDAFPCTVHSLVYGLGQRYSQASHSPPRTSSTLQLIRTLFSLPFLVSHRFTTAQLICDSTAILIENFSLGRGSYSALAVEFIARLPGCQKTNETNASSFEAIARALHLPAWPRRQGPYLAVIR